jgi:hypothetical protein
MRHDSAQEDLAAVVMHHCDEAILVPTDIEDDATPYRVSRRTVLTDVREFLPVGPLDCSYPDPERFLCLSVDGPEFAERCL